LVRSTPETPLYCFNILHQKYRSPLFLIKCAIFQP
jgi:hypothetical protein